MPQPKRRKLSLDEQDGKEREKNRIATGTDEGVDKYSSDAAGLAKAESCGLQTQTDKKTSQSKSERKAEGATQSSSSMVSSVEDGRDGTATVASTGDGCERVSSSGRVIKQTKKGRCFTAALEAAQNKQSSSTGQGVGSTGHPSSRSSVGKSSTPIRRKRGRKRRSWDLWSKFEQDAFFEGLFEHGKDFDAIHNLLVFRSKKRGIETALIKTKEQVRHLYYRMWQKISKHVDMGNNVKKEAQEIYGLVNYYAIRKVFKRMDERAVEHLNELIVKGVSKVREPNAYGKKIRKKLRVLRTPVCNALKKLNNIEDSKEEFVSDMPQQVTVELTPRSSAAWLKVHNLSHNPRVRFQVSVNRSLACLMEHLKKKWKGSNDRLRSNLGETDDRDELVVFPHHTYTLEPVTLAAQRATSVDLITFSSYCDNVLSSPPAGSRSAKKVSEDAKQGGDILSDGDGHVATDPPKRSRSAKKGGDDVKPPIDILSDGDGHGPAEHKPVVVDHPKPVKSSVKINLLPKLSDPVVQMPQPPCEDENAMFPDAPLFSPPAAKEDSGDCSTLEASWATATNCTCDSEEHHPADPAPSPDTSPQLKDRSRDWRKEERATDMRRLVETATKGFTQQSSKLVTLAKLSLMLGKTSHIRLEYDWRPKWQAMGGAALAPSSIVGDVERLTNMLRRLSSLANLEYRDLMQRGKMAGGGKMSQCTLCGHSLERVTTRKKMTSDVATETDPLTEETFGGVSVMHPAQLNSNGTLVGMASKSTFLSPLQAPDTDGVFRVPMPIAVPMSVRPGCPQKTSVQQSLVGKMSRPQDSQASTSRLDYLAPHKRRPRKKPTVGQRTLLPKMPGSSLILVPHNLLQPLPGAATPVPSPSAQPAMSHQAILQTEQAMAQQTEVAMGDHIMSSVATGESCMVTTAVLTSMTPVVSAITTMASSAVTAVSSTVSSHPDVDGGAPVVTVGNLMGENSVSSSDLFPCHLDMPVIVSPNPSPVKSTHQLISSSVSPPSLSAMLDISLAAPSNQASNPGDKFLEMVADGNAGFSGLLKSPQKRECSLMEEEEVGGQQISHPPQHSLSTPRNNLHTPTHHPTLGSPSHRSPLKAGAESQWLGQEVPDLSLCGFEDSPVKKSSSSVGVGENSNSADLHTHSLSLSHFLQQSPVKKEEGLGLGSLGGENGNGSSLHHHAHPLSLSPFLQSPVKKSEALEGGGGGGVAMPTLSVPSTSSGPLASSSFIPAPPSLFGESSQDSLVARLDVDTTLQSMMMESSIDYSSKFEKLAEHLDDNTDASQPHL
ncbi:uncharacterized protein LOC143298537 [Babylonia areolata]|uniref:uncharacterized protein LOC143298537 n=1 Tax=Babylonia areolata TaxID=304850 RepID=UPI003FD0385B